MAEEVQGEEVVVEEGTTAEGVQEEEVVTLPSDTPEFEVPEKFKDKSTEEIIKSYLELEKMKSKPQEEEVEGGDEVSKEEDNKEPSKELQETYNKYAEKLDKDGSLSEEDYAELAKAGYDKAAVDEEIAFREFKRERALKDVLEPLGGGAEKFKEVTAWVHNNKTPEEIADFNSALAAAPKLAQQALLKQLYGEYEGANTGDTTIHTSTPQVQSGKGYASEADFFKDIGSPDYTSHKSFAKAVEDKLAKTDTTGWSIG